MTNIEQTKRLSTMFRYYNRRFFNSKLTGVEVGFSKRKNFVLPSNFYRQVINGKYHYTIVLNSALKGTHYEGVLLHEMTILFMHHLDLTGSLNFDAFAKRILKELNINIKDRHSYIPKLYKKEMLYKKIRNIKLKKVTTKLL